MKIAAQKTFIVAVVVLFFITLIPACQEEAIQESPSDAGRVRILKSQKADLEQQILDLKKTHAEELEEQKQLLAKCETENATLRTNAGKNAGMLLNQLLMPLRQQNEELQKENADLKEQIRQLKGN